MLFYIENVEDSCLNNNKKKIIEIFTRLTQLIVIKKYMEIEREGGKSKFLSFEIWTKILNYGYNKLTM